MIIPTPLFRGLDRVTNEDKFTETREEVINNVFDEIFRLQKQELLVWKRTGRYLSEFVTEVDVVNIERETVRIPVYLYSLSDDEGNNTWYLSLEYKGGPVLSCSSKKVRDLYKQITGRDIPPGGL